MARKTAKAVYKNLTQRDLFVMILKAKILEELIHKTKQKEDEKAGWWFF